MSAALYHGVVRHTRIKPVRHALRYRIFMILADLQSLADDTARTRLFSLDRFNLFSLHRADHGDASQTPLLAQVSALMDKAGAGYDGGRIAMLFMPRVLGYAFNPLTVYYAYRRDASLCAILYEVHNTFGERHAYLLPVRAGEGVIEQEADKCFHVSPFMDMQMQYRFRVQPPGETLSLAIFGDGADGPTIATSFHAQRAALSDGALLKAFVSAPLLGLKVIGGIHWEAWKLWRKGLRLRPHPVPPQEPVSFGAPDLRAPEALHPAG